MIKNPFLHYDPEPIPELPVDIEGHARHVTKEDVLRYIKPLYTRLWGIDARSLTYNRGSKRITRMLPQLSKGFSFVHNTTASQFMLDVINFAREEEASLISLR